MDKNWYVVHAPDVKISELVKKMKLKLGEDNVLFPVITDRKLNKRVNKFIDKEYPLYFNYIFVRLDGYNPKVEDDLRSACSAHITILSDPESKRWTPVSEEEMKNVYQTMKDVKAEITKIGTDFETGEEVKITVGPFKFFNGVIKKIDLRRRKVVLDVYVFKRETSTEVDIEGIEKIK